MQVLRVSTLRNDATVKFERERRSFLVSSPRALPLGSETLHLIGMSASEPFFLYSILPVKRNDCHWLQSSQLHICFLPHSSTSPLLSPYSSHRPIQTKLQRLFPPHQRHTAPTAALAVPRRRSAKCQNGALATHRNFPNATKQAINCFRLRCTHPSRGTARVENMWWGLTYLTNCSTMENVIANERVNQLTHS